MKAPPFLLVNCVERLDDAAVKGSGRSVAFPVAKTKRGRYLFCTCSHTITEHIARGGSLHFYYADGTEVRLSERILNNVIPPEMNLDVCFFEADIDREIGFARLTERSIVSGLELCHVRNVCFKADFPDQKSVITTQVVGAVTGKFMFGGNRFHKVDADLNAFRALPKNSHKGIAIRSWPGVSGSPLWDKSGSVLGMVAGGTEKLTEESPDYNLIYLPAKQIQSCMRMFLTRMIA